MHRFSMPCVKVRKRDNGHQAEDGFTEDLHAPSKPVEL